MGQKHSSQTQQETGADAADIIDGRTRRADSILTRLSSSLSLAAPDQTHSASSSPRVQFGNSSSDDVRVLFLGLPGSGRGSIIGAIREFHAREQGTNPNLQFREIIQFHALQSIKQIIQAAKVLDVPLYTVSHMTDEERDLLDGIIHSVVMKNFTFGETVLDREIGRFIMTIWERQEVKDIVETHLGDTRIAHLTDIPLARFYLDNIDRIASEDYVPTDDDVELYHDCYNNSCRGIEEVELIYSGTRYRIFNVEGQKNETRKWLHHFEGVDIICFLCPIGDFDLQQEEFSGKNVVVESLELFGNLSNNEWFMETPICLLFTKFDLFQKKIEETDMICIFEDYVGGCVAESAIKFLTEKFFNARKKGKIDDVFINFVSKEQSITYMVNNIAGILKNVLYLKKHELVERRRRIEQDRAERLANRSLLARSISVKSTSSLRKLLAEADTQPLSSTPSDSPPLSSPSPSRKISMLARKASVYRKRETDT